MEFDIVLGGLGGQGIRLSSQILAQAAGFEGKQAYQNNIYGGGVRGGAINATVVIADREVLSPVRDEPYGALAMDQRHTSWFTDILRSGGIMVYNSTIAKPPKERPDTYLIPIPATALAEERLGNIMLASMVALGAFVEVTGVVSLQSIEDAIPEILPAHRKELIQANCQAARLGAETVRPLVEQRSYANLALKG